MSAEREDDEDDGDADKGLFSLGVNVLDLCVWRVEGVMSLYLTADLQPVADASTVTVMDFVLKYLLIFDKVA